jgi:hypothetical protein
MLFPLLCSSHPALHHQHFRQEILVQGLVCKGSSIKLHSNNVNLEHKYSLSMSLKKRGQQIFSEDKTVMSTSGNITYAILYMAAIVLYMYVFCLYF